MILFYPGNLAHDPQALQALQKALNDQPVRYLSDDVLDHPLKDLTNPQTQVSYNPAEMVQDYPFLLFSGYALDQVSKFQNLIEQAGLPIRAMAIETANNREMVLSELMAEVEREAKYFEKRDELADLLNGLDPDRLQADQDYFKCAMLAANLLRQDELSENMLDTALKIMHSFDKK